MADTATHPGHKSGRALVIGLISVVLVSALALILVVFQTGRQVLGNTQINYLENSNNACVTCHERSTPGIVEQYGHSSMAAAKVACEDCHEVAEDYPGAIAHEGTYILGAPTTAMCQGCHQSETAQYAQSRHALPAWVAYAGMEGLSEDQLAQYEAIPEGQFAPNRDRNVIAMLEGETITRFACETCHAVGQPKVDGSVGDCAKCHLRHEFSLEQARKPETCNACHIGPDHPQWEIYQESPHGIKYATDGHTWNWEAESGSLTPADFPAPTCATCHFSGFGASGVTHDVGERLTWYLFAPVSERRPAWQDNLVRMQNVCSTCHNREFIQDFYLKADEATLAVNAFVNDGTALLTDLQARELVNSEPFDEAADFAYFELWHHWGRTAKFGVWMQGPDYTQWHGAYEMLKELVELKEIGETGSEPDQPSGE